MLSSCAKIIAPRASHVSRLSKSLICSYYSNSLRPFYNVSEEIKAADPPYGPVVALETAIYTHGLPYPDNLKLAHKLDEIVRSHGAIPATVGMLKGQWWVGMSLSQIEELVESPMPRKLSTRDLALMAGQGLDGGSTVAATLQLASMARIPIMATGGIGGVHKGAEASFDISADLIQLGRSPVAVICSGCKGFLDIPKTLEYLETQGVCVATFVDGRQGEIDFPAFWSRDSGIRSPAVLENEQQAADILVALASLEPAQGMVFANPIPTENSISRHEIRSIIESATKSAAQAGAAGSANTPFILDAIKTLTEGKSVVANQALVEANVARAARVAVRLSQNYKTSQKNGTAQKSNEHPTAYKFFPGASVTSTKANVHTSKSVSYDASPSEPPDIVVAGSIVSDLICDYMPISSSISKSSPALHTSNPARITETIGGVGFNIAKTIALKGGLAELCSVTGNDSAADGFIREMQRLNMSARSLEQVSGRPSGRYVAVNDANKSLVLGMAEMASMESSQLKVDRWGPLLQSMAKVSTSQSQQPVTKWLVADANWSARMLHQWLLRAHSHGLATAFEPVSTAKATRIFEHALNFGLPRVVDLATPNELELVAMHTFARETGLLERQDWWQTIDALGIPSTGARSELVAATSADLVDEGIPQRSIQLLPFIPNLATTLGAKGVLLTRVLLRDDPALSEDSKYVVARSFNIDPETKIAGLYMRLFSPPERLLEGEVKNVNGAGDAFVGALVTQLARTPLPRIENCIDYAQAASLEVLKGNQIKY